MLERSLGSKGYRPGQKNIQFLIGLQFQTWYFFLDSYFRLCEHVFGPFWDLKASFKRILSQ